MENTVHAPEVAAENASDIGNQVQTHMSMLAPPETAAEAPAAAAECMEIVPSYQVQPASDQEPDLPALPEHLRQMPFRLELRVPLSRFTLRDLQQLKPGALLVTEHLSVRDLVLTAAGERLLLVELEAIEQQLAARVKRLAWRHKWRRKA
jgi:flagellar motor switch protein FliM